MQFLHTKEIVSYKQRLCYLLLKKSNKPVAYNKIINIYNIINLQDFYYTFSKKTLVYTELRMKNIYIINNN